MISEFSALYKNAGLIAIPIENIPIAIRIIKNVKSNVCVMFGTNARVNTDDIINIHPNANGLKFILPLLGAFVLH